MPGREPERPLAVHVTTSLREGRVRAALRCPYCHAQVARRDDAVGCARPACGTLYHRECWGELARFDGCAALGCGSREAREVSALGYLVRLVRLLVAALLFPRRVVRRLREAEDAGPASILRRSLRAAWSVIPSLGWAPPTDGKWIAIGSPPSAQDLARGFLYLALALPITIGLSVYLVRGHQPDPFVTFGLVIASALAATLVTAFSLALLGATTAFVLHVLARAFAREVTALGRAEAPDRPRSKPTGK